MIILLLAEARSGSTNLSKWLNASLPEFVLLNEPYNPISNDYIGNAKIDTTKNLIISEKYFNNEELINQLLSISDIVVCLYREDANLQIESYLTALSTDNWYGEYNEVILDEMLLDKKNEFILNKQNFQNYITNKKLKSFSYEQLYYKNGIDELKSYLSVKSNIQFPYGKKYRIKTNKTIL